MARKFLTHLDLQGNQILNAAFEKLTTDPTTGNFEGRVYYNTASDELRFYDGDAWQVVGDKIEIQGTTNEVTVAFSAETNTYTISLPATITADLNGNASTATKLATARTIALGGDLSGSASFDGSENVTITASVQPDSVALGTDTTGNYVATIDGDSGVSVSGAGTEGRAVTIANTDKGSSQNIFKNVVVGATTVIADNNDDTLTIDSGTGIGLTANATTDTVTISNTGVLSVSGTADQIAASTTNGAVTVSLPNAVTFPGTVTLNADPTQALQAATKQYVDSVAEGLHVHASVATATTANISDLTDPPATIDGVTLTEGMRVLVKDQTNLAENGIYVLNSEGELVRASDYDTAAEVQAGDFVFVVGGTSYSATGWVQEKAVDTLGTDPIVWSQFSGAGSYLAGNGLNLTGSTFSIDTAVTVDLSTAQTLTNKTLTSPNVTGLQIRDTGFVVEGFTDDEFETTVVFTDPTADRTITFKDATGTVALTTDIPQNTDGLTEGSTNLYFTDERAQDAVGGIISGSNSLSAVYNDAANTLTFDTTLATTSYLSKTSGLAVDISALETKLIADSFTKKATANVGNGENTSFAVTHNLGTRDVQVQVYDNATYDTVEVDVVRTDANTVTVSFTIAPANNAYRVVVIG
jgi:uncharacterized RmlC-like cupin family protein